MKIIYAELEQRLTDSFTTLTPQLQTAARYFLEHPEEVGLNSMRHVAKAAGVKPATITRLSKALGFSEYEQLREPFRQRLRSQPPEYSARLRDVQRRGVDDTHALFEEVRAQDIDNIQRTLSDDMYATLLDAAETLQAGRRVYVLGLRGAYSVAFLFHYAYQMFRDNSQLLDGHAGIFADQLRDINADDSMLVVSIPPYTQLTIDAVGYAAEAGASIVAITDSGLSPAALSATHTIIAHNKSPSFYQSFTASLCVSQALITLLVSQSGGNALEIIKEAEQQLSRVSAYW